MSKRDLRAVTKATRSKLHQAYGAYESRVDYERAYRSLEATYAIGETEVVRAACTEVLALHTSTRERLPILERLYSEVFRHTGVPRTILDLACGLNPLSLPWMGLGGQVTYHAYDIDAARVAFLDRYLGLPGMAGVRGDARLQDVLCHPPAERGDVALLMKSSACLERQRAGATLDLIDALDVHHVVVTYPVHSLGRRRKGMPQHYERTFLAMVSDRPWPVTRLRFETELVYVIFKSSPTDEG